VTEHFGRPERFNWHLAKLPGSQIAQTQPDQSRELSVNPREEKIKMASDSSASARARPSAANFFRRVFWSPNAARLEVYSAP
jgi:hypothetical protein